MSLDMSVKYKTWFIQNFLGKNQRLPRTKIVFSRTSFPNNMKLRLLKCIGGGGLANITTPSFIKAQCLGYFKLRKMNREHWNHIKKTLLWSPRKLLRIAMLSIIPLRKTFFLMKVIFIQGAFKNIQGLLWKIQGLFKDIAQFFNFQGLFKDTMLFQGLFKTRVNHAKRP